MQKLKSENEIINKKLTNEFCQDCALGKSRKLPHKTVENPSDLRIIRSNLAGPMQTESIGNKKRSMLTYICSQTEYSFVYFKKQNMSNLKNLSNLKVCVKYIRIRYST
jgi:hypothetical protein